MKVSLEATALHERALQLSSEIRRHENLLVTVLGEIDDLGFFKKMGYPSLFVYAVSALGLSEATAYAFITVSRRAKSVGALATALSDGKISVAKASRLAAGLTCENVAHLLEYAQTHSTRECEREMARLSGDGQKERRYTLKISASLRAKLARAQSLLSSQKRRHVEPEEALELVLDEFLERRDPVKKAERAKKPMNSERSKSEHGRARLTAQQSHAVMRRDDGRCTFVDANDKDARVIAGSMCIISEKWRRAVAMSPQTSLSSVPFITISFTN